VKSQIFHTGTEEETIALGEMLAKGLPVRAVVLLIGQLGAGKTTLAKGIVKGLGAAAPEDVSSPTFTLIHEYSPLPHGRGSLAAKPANMSRDREGAVVYHIDLYRLDTPAQVATLGLDEIFDRRAVVLIEWGERFPELMPAERIEIRLRTTGENSREIELRAPERALQWD
jgi:tRNA threonylcarbamoyladenosine biosynthesis protein TsaE